MKETTIFGPPGTGKTTYLIDLVKDHLIGGVTPKNIAFMSFSKKAATEAKARALRDLDLDPKDMTYFRTLHSLAFSWLGLSVAELPQEIAQKLSIDGGVVISSSEGVSRGAGLLTGDVITSVNNKNVVSVSQFRTAVSNSKKGKVLVFLVRRGAEAMFVPVKP